MRKAIGGPRPKKKVQEAETFEEEADDLEAGVGRADAAFEPRDCVFGERALPADDAGEVCAAVVVGRVSSRDDAEEAISLLLRFFVCGFLIAAAGATKSSSSAVMSISSSIAVALLPPAAFLAIASLSIRTYYIRRTLI